MENRISPSLRAAVALEKHGFRHAHSLGQNFITDDAFINGLLDASGVCKDDCVLEIGPGAGIMTAALAERCGHVLAIELDQRLEGVLSDVLAPYDNVQVVFQDAMKADLRALTKEAFGERPFRVVANLPYYITADIILRLLMANLPMESACVMVQKEAAERMMASVGEKNWCALSATVQYFAQPEVLADVPPEMFTPSPHVFSQFLRLDLYKNRPVKMNNEELFLKLIQCAFAMRRKTLANNLKATFHLEQAQAIEILRQTGIGEMARGEALTLPQLAALSDNISTKIIAF